MIDCANKHFPPAAYIKKAWTLLIHVLGPWKPRQRISQAHTKCGHSLTYSG